MSNLLTDITLDVSFENGFVVFTCDLKTAKEIVSSLAAASYETHALCRESKPDLAATAQSRFLVAKTLRQVLEELQIIPE